MASRCYKYHCEFVFDGHVGYMAEDSLKALFQQAKKENAIMIHRFIHSSRKLNGKIEYYNKKYFTIANTIE